MRYNAWFATLTGASVTSCLIMHYHVLCTSSCFLVVAGGTCAGPTSQSEDSGRSHDSQSVQVCNANPLLVSSFTDLLRLFVDKWLKHCKSDLLIIRFMCTY